MESKSKEQIIKLLDEVDMEVGKLLGYPSGMPYSQLDEYGNIISFTKGSFEEKWSELYWAMHNWGTHSTSNYHDCENDIDWEK